MTHVNIATKKRDDGATILKIMFAPLYRVAYIYCHLVERAPVLRASPPCCARIVRTPYTSLVVVLGSKYQILV